MSVPFERPSWAAPARRWETLEIGQWVFCPPDIIVVSVKPGLKLREDHHKARGKDRGPRKFGGLDTPLVDVQLHVISRAGEKRVRDALKTDLIPQKDVDGRRYLPLKYPSLQELRLTHGAVIEWSEESPTNGYLPVHLKIAISDGNASKKSATISPKQVADVPIIDFGRSTGAGKDLRDFDRPKVSLK